MNDLVDLRLHHHIAQEIYRQQMLQRLPGMFLLHIIFCTFSFEALDNFKDIWWKKFNFYVKWVT